MRKIKVAQIGTLHDHAPSAFETLCKLTDYFEVVGYACTSDVKPKSKVYEGYKEYSVDEILNYPGLEAVAIECDEINLTQYARRAAEKGLHIHMDKPGGISQTEYDALLDYIKERNLVFSTGYMYRSNPAVLKALELMKSGELGTVYAVEAHMDCLHTPEKRQWLSQFPGGMMFFLGCHLVDLVHLFMGEPDNVVAYNKNIKTDGVTAKDYSMAVFEYKNGTSFVKSCANEPGGFMRRQLVICGTNATVEIKPIEYDVVGGQCADMRITYANSPGGWGARGEVETFGPRCRYSDMLIDFYDYILKNKENPFTFEYESKTHALTLKACGMDPNC